MNSAPGSSSADTRRHRCVTRAPTAGAGPYVVVALGISSHTTPSKTRPPALGAKIIAETDRARQPHTRCNAVRTAEHIEAGDAETGATALTAVLERLLTTGLNPSIFYSCQNHFLNDDLIDHITAASDADECRCKDIRMTRPAIGESDSGAPRRAPRVVGRPLPHSRRLNEHHE
jgi:hypothetical protein